MALALIALLVLSSCSNEAEEMVGMRPAAHLPAVVEAYLQRYQPGPLPRLFQTTYVYDRNGVQLAELFEEGRRTWVSLDRMAPELLEATVATEDVTFYTNLGVDPFRIAAAAWSNTSEGRIISGASTITMQLARNLFLGPDQRYDASMDRKLLEAGLAQELTARYSKDEILEMYLNMLNYGNLAYGPEAAAWVYFGKHASQLTRAEATLLAGIPQQPALLDPFRNFPAVKQRQSVVLELMVRHNFITQEEADAIFREPINLRPAIDRAPNLAPHFVQYMVQMIDERLGPGYTARAGFNLFSTLDLRIQNLAQRLVSERVAQGRQRYNMSNAALVALRPGTAEVLAMVGSVNFNDDSIGGQVNVALMPRQPGSAIKPLLYATAFHDLLLSPASAMWDLPVAYDLGGNQFYRPENYDRRFHGVVSARTALANSYNVPAVRLLDTMGVVRALSGAHALGVRSLNEPPTSYNLTMALGGHEVTLMDLVIGYHTIANDGKYLVPQVAQTFLDSESQLIHPLAPPEPIQAISPGAAFLVTDILSDNRARAPAFGTNSPLRISVPAAVKTGTTNSFRDNWTVGYTKYLLAGVWVGNSDGRPMRNTTGVTGAAPIWHDFMEAVVSTPELLKTLGVPADDPEAWAFTPPPDVVRREACPMNLTCREEGEFFTRDWMAVAGRDGPLADMFITAPTVPVHLDRSGNPWGPLYCSQPGGQERTLFRLADIQGLAGVDNGAHVGRVAGLASPDPGALQQETTGRSVVFYYPDTEIERMRRLQWARNQGMEINVGDCAALQYYTVQAGEQWNSVARRFNLTVGELQSANPHIFRRDGVLRPGDRLLAPNGIPIEVSERNTFHTVQAGDTWGSIAQQYSIPLRFLQTVNPDVVRPYFLLSPGDQIFIPTSEQLARVLH
jgi:penicillin-binding protein 1C